jgi:hypothetical protein
MVAALAGVTGGAAIIERAMPSAEATAGTVGSTGAPRAMRATASPALPLGGV